MLADYLNSSLTNVCNLSLPIYAEQGSNLEGRGIAKNLTIAFCDALSGKKKENVSLNRDLPSLR